MTWNISSTRRSAASAALNTNWTTRPGKRRLSRLFPIPCMMMTRALSPSISRICIFLTVFKIPSMAKDIIATIKMYQVGELGDCFFLRFTDGTDQSDVLIDCGSFRNKQASKDRLNTIVKHIKSLLGDRKLDVVVGTHQHNDHLSGFVHCETLFTGLINQVWLSWLDNPNDSLARQIGKDQKGLVSQLQAIHSKLSAIAPLKQALKDGVVQDVLGFYASDGGGDPEIPAKGIENLRKIGDKEVAYLSPGQQLDLPGLPAGSVKVYVLGPPRDQALLFDKDPKKGESYDPKLAIAGLNATRLLSALDNYDPATHNREEEQFPFNKSFRLSPSEPPSEILKIYEDKKNSWHKIDLE